MTDNEPKPSASEPKISYATLDNNPAIIATYDNGDMRCWEKTDFGWREERRSGTMPGS
jgi:hypothetical protein